MTTMGEAKRMVDRDILIYGTGFHDEEGNHIPADQVMFYESEQAKRWYRERLADQFRGHMVVHCILGFIIVVQFLAILGLISHAMKAGV